MPTAVLLPLTKGPRLPLRGPPSPLRRVGEERSDIRKDPKRATDEQDT